MSTLLKAKTSVDCFVRFISTSLNSVLEAHEAMKSEDKFLALFHRCVSEVPAYRQFLVACGIQPSEITTFSAFKTLPLMNKPDYMQAYPLPLRCLGGSLADADRVALSSGSTGTPTFWPRSMVYELDVARYFEQVFYDSFRVHERSTLAVVCFALGNWVGGLYTSSCCWHLASKGYPLMVATPGNNKAEIFRIVRELAPHFKQTVLLGYPPFVKDVIETGLVEGIDWCQHQTRLVFAGEVFSEEWRDLVGQRIGSGSPCFDSSSLYGTADGGVLGIETPYSIAIRRWLAKHPKAARLLFGESRLPTLVQYDPVNRFFETHEGTLVVSAENTVPLVRYHIADKGDVLSFDEMWTFLTEQGLHSFDELGLPEGFEPRTLPFVYVFGRADFTVSYYGANIYPENVTVGLEQAEVIQWVTGKFVLETQEDDKGDKYLHIMVELLPNSAAEAGLSSVIASSIRNQLLRLNSEFANYTPAERQLPLITLCPFADPEYFPVGVKHRYTRK